MKLLVTGSTGHLGEALVRTWRAEGHEVVSVDVLPSAFTSHVGSITDRAFIVGLMAGVDAVLHAATLHKPHVATHAAQRFIDTNITGTLVLLEAAVAAGVKAFVFTSTTSVFGDALVPPPGSPAGWVTEELKPVPKNIYGVTKVAAEDLCELHHRNHRLPCIVLRTSRFFPEEDDQAATASTYSLDNVWANEILYRRVEIEDVVSAHRLAIEKAASIGFGRFVISATTPFTRDDLARLRVDAHAVLADRFPAFETLYAKQGWRMFPVLDRVYVNERARRVLGWAPRHDFQHVLDRLAADRPLRSALAGAVGAKGYHAQAGGAGGSHVGPPSPPAAA